MKNKGVGFCFLLISAVTALIALIYYTGWASGNNAMNTAVILCLAAGICVNVLLIFYDNDFLVIAVTALLSAALLQLLVDSVGSFVDAFQGIVMFGDPAQVGSIISISAFICVGIFASIIAGFLKRKKS
jgi:hypothetical protein